MIKRLAIVLAAAGMLGLAAPASAQVFVDDGYHGGRWGGPYAYGGWWGGPRASVVIRRHHFVPRDRFYGRSWWGDY